MSGTENAVARAKSTRSRGDSQPICARQATGGDVKIRFDKVGYPLYCDAGPYEGDMRIDLNIRLYLSPEEYARYAGSESLQITLQENGDGRLGTGNAAEPSGELSRGDMVVAGEAPLMVERFGFTPLRGALTPRPSTDDAPIPWRPGTRPQPSGPRPGRPRNKPPSPNWRTQ